MQNKVHHRRTLLQFGTVVVPLAALLVYLPSAHAGCGDYVIRKSVSSKAEMSKASTSSSPMTHGPASPHKDGRPCSGPSCSNGQSTPDLPVTPTAPDHEEWAIKGIAYKPFSESDGLLSFYSLSHPLVQPGEIFHPPRCDNL
jgi:hypothetical protein